MPSEHTLEQLFAEVDLIALPPSAEWEPRAPRRTRSFASFGAFARNASFVAAVITAVVVFLVVRTSVTPPVAATVTPSAATPVASASSSPSPTASTSGQPTAPTPVLEAHALGALTGDYAFAVVREPTSNAAILRMELWAVPLDGRTPTLGVAWQASAGALITPGPTVVARQLSPDGRRFVAAGVGGVFVADLAAGTTRLLTPEGDTPMWSPTDGRIVFARWTSLTTQAVWSVRTDGSRLEELATVDGAITWSPDGAMLASTTGAFALNPAPRRVASWPDAVNGGARPVDWRAARPAVALVASATTDGGEQRLEVLDSDFAARVVAQEVGSLTQTVFQDPRWHPTAERVLYVRTGSAGVQVRVADVQRNTQQVVATIGAVRRAEWNPSGNRVVYVSTTATGQDELRFTARLDGSATNEGVLLSLPGRARAEITDIGCVTLR